MARIFLLVSILLLPITSFAELSFEQLNQVTTTPEHLQGQFKQEKYLKDIDVTLHSSGKFSYERSKSIRWETLKPIQNMLVMTPQGIINSQDGKETMKLEAESNPAVNIFSDIFFAVLTSEWEALTAYFSLSGTLEHAQWNVELTPIDDTIAQAVSKIELKGGELLQELTFYENNGNTTIIRFDQLTQ